MIPLLQLKKIPGSLKNLSAKQVRQVFKDPTVIELEGRRKEPLFISFLLHGNETTSFYVLQKLQAYLEEKPLLRSLILFIGNVYATEQSVRFLPEQIDYNRVWLDGESKEHHLAQNVKTIAKNRSPLFASIDIHNNTGTNPYYSCINTLLDSSVYLASLFSRTIVYFQNPSTAQSTVFSQFCPSVTLECGQSGQLDGVEKAFKYILDIMHLECLSHTLRAQDVDIYETVGRVVVKEDINFSFDSSGDLKFCSNFDKLNFSPMNQGDKFASYPLDKNPLQVFDDAGQDQYSKYFIQDKNQILLSQNIIPAMFTKDKKVIRQDCLGYMMKKVNK